MKRALLAALLVASVLAPAAVASSPPQPLCSVCGDRFEHAADRHDVSATVVESAVEVGVAEDATARWTVRNRLTNESTAERLGEDDDLLEAVVATALDGYDVKPDPDGVSDVSSQVDGKTVTTTFADDSFADRDPGGVVVVEHFHSGGSIWGQELVAERFAVVGPGGYAVVNDPTAGEVEDGRVTWGDSHPSDTYVAFARDDGILTDAAVSLAFARRTLPAVVDNLLMLTPAVVAAAVGLAAFRNVVRAGLGPRRVDRFAAGVVGVGLLAVAHPAYAGTVPLINDTIPALTAAGIVYALVGVTALALDRMHGLTRTRGAVPWWWLLAPALGVPVAGIASPETFGYVGRSVVPGQVLLAVPVATAFPLGYAVARGDARAQFGALAATAGAIAAVALDHISFTQEPFTGGLIAILATALATFGLAFALPAFMLGASLARDADRS